ncbi:hypothetical protein PN499_08900, partial [Kamptonema animale CS-326]|uniref:DUF6745 domain-containing protein n=1 Tax=Kamptonema animale TaxID=92934 RepID=UPI002330A802
MSETKIDKLTPEQEALIPVYQEKWRQFSRSTEPINYNQAAEVIKSVYELMGKQEPEIIFCSNPYQGLELGTTQPSEQRIIEHIWRHLWEKLYRQLKVSVVEPPWKEVRKILGDASLWMHQELRNRVNNSLKLELQLANYIETQHWAYSCILFEISIFLFNYLHDQKHWEVFQLLVKHCGCVILPYEKTCIICDRPRILSFDNQHRLHAEGTPAIQFADGYSLYSYHGVTLPEKYGKLH